MAHHRDHHAIACQMVRLVRIRREDVVRGQAHQPCGFPRRKQLGAELLIWRQFGAIVNIYGGFCFK